MNSLAGEPLHILQSPPGAAQTILLDHSVDYWPVLPPLVHPLCCPVSLPFKPTLWLPTAFRIKSEVLSLAFKAL